MYKIKIINYQPYEYELLQDLLNDLSSKGYETNQLHFISLFKKTNQNQQYIVDLFQPQGSSFLDKNASEDRFLDQYLERNYKKIYSRKGLYVFKGQQDLPPIQWQNKAFVLDKIITKNISLFLLMAFITIGFYIYSQSVMTIDTFLSYGRTLIYIGLLTLFLLLTYKFFMNAFCHLKLKKQLTVGKTHLKKSILSLFHIIYIIACFLTAMMFVLGFIEDTINQESITIKDYPTITLNDLNMNKETISTYTKHEGFQIPCSTQYLEYTKNQENILLVKTYQFHSENKAKKQWHHFYQNPSEYSCDKIKKEGNVLYGYTNNELTCLLFQKNKSIILVSINFSLNQQQLQTIMNTYQ